MIVCPVCNNELPDGTQSCTACGFTFKGLTQEFKPVCVDTPEQTGPITIPNPTLTIKYGKQEGLNYQLEKSPVTIGRDPSNDIFLNDMTVSRKHALIEKVQNAWVIKDCDSFNGVWINNKNVTQAALSDGDALQVGCFVLRYHQ